MNLITTAHGSANAVGNLSISYHFSIILLVFHRIRFFIFDNISTEQNVNVTWDALIGKVSLWVHLTLNTPPQTTYDELQEAILTAFPDRSLKRMLAKKLCSKLQGFEKCELDFKLRKFELTQKLKFSLTDTENIELILVRMSPKLQKLCKSNKGRINTKMQIYF